MGDWETHKDLSGRYFYYNRASGERTWKPPRSRDTCSSISSVRGDSQGTAESEVLFKTKVTLNVRPHLSDLFVETPETMYNFVSHIYYTNIEICGFNVTHVMSHINISKHMFL